MAEIVYTVGQRIKITNNTGRNKVYAALSFVLSLLLLAGSIGMFFIDIAAGIAISLTFFFPAAAWSWYCFYVLASIHSNNRNNNPPVGLTSDGVMVLCHANGKKDYLYDKIVGVAGLPKRIRKLAAGGSQLQIWETNYGKVILTLMKAGGVQYKKSVNFVYMCAEVAAEIKKLLNL